MLKIFTAIGSRSEAVKLAPLILKIKAETSIGIETYVTGQYHESVNDVLFNFGLDADGSFGLDKTNPSLFETNCALLSKFENIFAESKPNIVLALAGTSTSFAASVSAAYFNTSVVHIEAGLSSGLSHTPFPSEIHRKMISCISELQFAPSKNAMNKLKSQGIDPYSIWVTGSSAIDALLHMLKSIDDKYCDSHWQAFFGEPLYSSINLAERKLILVTSDQRLNSEFDTHTLCQSIKSAAQLMENLDFVYPMEFNPKLRKTISSELGGLNNVHLVDNLNYAAFVWLLKHAYIVVTDSSTLQEEAPFIGKPVLLTTNVTDHHEAIQAGAVKHIGPGKSALIEALNELVNNRAKYHEISSIESAYGDGRASERILAVIKNHYHITRRQEEPAQYYSSL